MSQAIFEEKYPDNQFLDLDAVEEKKVAEPPGSIEGKHLLDSLYTALNIVKSHHKDAEIHPRFKTFPRFRAHIIKLAKDYLRRGGYKVSEIKKNQERMAPLLMKHFFKRKNKYGKLFKWVEDKNQILARNPKNEDWNRWVALRNTKDNISSASECDQLIALNLIKPLTRCNFHTNLGRKEGLIKPKEIIETPNFDCRLYNQVTKAGKMQYRIASFCTLCGHKKNVIVKQKALKGKGLRDLLNNGDIGIAPRDSRIKTAIPRDYGFF